jgi:N-acetylglucosamine kinase-like BadF-type ATPase
MVLAHWKLKDPEALVTHVYRSDVTHGDIAALVDPLLDLAAAGDKDAGRIVADAARDLAAHVTTAVTRLALERPPLAMTGGVLRRVAFKQALLGQIPMELGPVAMVPQPYLGAVVLAKRLAGIR